MTWDILILSAKYLLLIFSGCRLSDNRKLISE